MTSPEDGRPSPDTAADPDRETQNFPAYQPQGYPTYPPMHSPTTELPAVDAGGPPPSSAAAYAGPGYTPAGYTPPGNSAPGNSAPGNSAPGNSAPGNSAPGNSAPGNSAPGNSAPGNSAPGNTAPGYGMAAASSASAYGTPPAAAGKPARRGGAGFAGAVALIGLCSAAAGAFALPVQQFANSENTYFGTYRDLAAHKLVSSAANDHSISIVGGHIATDWWRYGVFGALGALAFLLLAQICVPVLRRVAGVLMFLGGLATVAGFLLGAHQTNDYSSVSRGTNLHRISWQHLAYGFWVAVAGCAVVALGGLIAGLQSTRR